MLSDKEDFTQIYQLNSELRMRIFLKTKNLNKNKFRKTKLFVEELFAEMLKGLFWDFTWGVVLKQLIYPILFYQFYKTKNVLSFSCRKSRN